MNATHDPERRRTPRVDLLAEYLGHLVTLDEPVHLRQLGEGGMTVATVVPISPTVEHEFRFTIGERAVHVRARVVHSRVLVRDDVVTYLTGLEFLDLSPEILAVLAELIRTAPARDAR
jgi:hypothetical protein